MKYDVCVFGGSAMDQTFFQKNDGSFSSIPDVISPGGKGANQAIAASKAGAKTIIITRLGNDEIGQKIVDNFQTYGVNTSCVEIENDLENDYSNIYINLNDKDNQIERHSGAIDSFTPDIVERYKDILLDSKIIVCQLKIPKEVTVELINFCHEHEKTLVLTPCRPQRLSILEDGNLELIDKINIITCNKKECETIFNTSDIETCVSKYPNKLIVTLGNEGLMYSDGTRIVKMPAIQTEVVDTTGAGDTLNGNLCAFLASGMDLRHALRKAMYASAMKLTVKTAQAGMPYLEDLEEYIQNCRNKNFEYKDELDFILKQVKIVYERVKYSPFTIHAKKDKTLVTDSDLAIENYLVKKILEKFPNDNFLTEENYSENTLLDRTWVIDPIDGTSHFIKGDGLWGIQLAFYDKGSTKFSVIYLPDKNELYYAEENNGAYVNNKKLFSNPTVPLNQSVVEFGGSIYKEFNDKRDILYNLMHDKKLQIANVLHINSSCVSYTNLATGKTDALVTTTKKLWDIMPGELICRESGMKVIYLNGDKTIKILSSNEELINLLLPSEVKVETPDNDKTKTI